jgi:hypothetical protein
MTTDEFESWFERGVTDGLPVVPPSRARVEPMLDGMRRDRAELLGEMPPNHGRLTRRPPSTSFGVFGPGFRANATVLPDDDNGEGTI